MWRVSVIGVLLLLSTIYNPSVV